MIYMKRGSGILLPISSLPSKYGIGCFSKEAYKFVDWLKSAKQTYWQILPMGPTSIGDSPYQGPSTFAGNPYFISLEDLIKEGVLKKKECEEADLVGHPQYVEYGKLYNERYKLLYKAYKRSNISGNEEFKAFCNKNAYWLDDYALYMAVKKCFEGKQWSEWAEDIRKRWGYSLDYYRGTYAEEIEFQKYMQFKFMEQWTKLKKYANEKGIKIIGDIPIYVAFDSADAWTNPHLFQFDEENRPYAVAGCPPDAFSETGQLWGNPLYRWDVHEQTGYDWWVKRLEHCYELYDVVRIDHFRAFDEYYSIPAKDTTAMNGKWIAGPGMKLFNTIKERLGEKDVIAEDLGLITDSVRKLVKDSGYPNMRVLEFAFVPRQETGYLPHEYDKNSVVYTGTHDNDTLMSWYKSLDRKTKKYIREYMNDNTTPDSEMNWAFIRLAMMSCANICIIPIQDYLGLGNEARLNFPSTLGTNWKWRLAGDELTKKLAKDIVKLTDISFRAPKVAEKKKVEDKETEAKAEEKNTETAEENVSKNEL